MPYVNRDNSPSSFTVWVASIYFVCLISQARHFSTLFNRDWTYLYCSWFWAGSIQSFIIKYDAIWGIFVDVLYQVEEIAFYDNLLSVFIMSRWRGFCQLSQFVGASSCIPNGCRFNFCSEYIPRFVILLLYVLPLVML